VLRIEAVWAEPGAPADAGAAIRDAIEDLGAWLGTEAVSIGKRVPRIWARALRS
jgi:uncharacterized protein YcaQ